MNLRSTSIADVVRLGSVVLFSAGLFTMIGCGGGSSSSGDGGGTMITVSVSPSTVNVALGAQTQFKATVTGTSNTAVTWEVNGVTGGSGSTGTISSSGNYTAPATVPSSTVTVTAVSQADTAVSGSATVTFPSIAVSVSPTTVTVAFGAQSQFTATVSGTSNMAVTWQVNGVTGGSSATGTISASGDYTAPATVPSSSVTVTAVSQADTSVSGSASVRFALNNTKTLHVNMGPDNVYGPNGLFTDVMICVPRTSSCQDISNVLVDTGSYGLRLLSSEVTLTLPETTQSGNVLQECVSFADGAYTWGPVATADIQMAGEKASAVPIQLISASEINGPSSCTSGTRGTNANTVQALGANGILGVGPFQQDCGAGCAGSSPRAQYYTCPNSVCAPATVALTSQLQNPVWLFTQDNNGVLISLPSVPASGALTVSGSMIFGIGTTSNNALGSAQLYTTDGCGNISTTFNGTTYSDTSTSCLGGTFFDTGSQGLYILDATTLNVPECPKHIPFYCPASTMNFTATNTGMNGTSAQVSFSIANADTIFGSNNAVLNNLAGANVGNSGSFDWGLPFFLGHNVFVGIEEQNSPTGVAGPYWAF